MKKLFVTLLVLIVLVAVGGYFLFIKEITPRDLPEKVTMAEEAVAASGTIAIASVDMTYIRRIDKLFAAANKDHSPLPAATSVKLKSKKTLLEKLKLQGVNLISETDYALATINVSQEKPAYSFVLFGRFNRDKLKQAIRKYYLVEESAAGYWLITEIAKKKKKDPCAVPSKKSALKQQAMHVQNDRIVLSSLEFMPVLLKRFAQKARAGVSLTKWRKYRKEKAVAGALMAPKEVNKGAVDISSALLLGEISKQPLNDIYAGAVVSLLPSPGFTVLVDARSRETAWPKNFKSKYDLWHTETVNELNEMPILASLFKSLKIQADGNILRFMAIADTRTLNNLEKVPAEFIKMIFENMVFGDDNAGGAEQIVKEEDLIKYASTFDFSSAEAFDTKSSIYKFDQVVGPFGVRLKKIGLLATDNSIIELKITTEGKGFENLSGELKHTSDNSPAASLLVTRVEDKKGNNLLRDEQCGKTRNSVAASLNISRDKEHIDDKWILKSLKVSGEKNVRLKENVLLSQVANITGKIVIRAATQTRAQTVQRPFKNKTVKTNNVRMILKKSSPRTVKYELSGDMNHIMAIRAKNAKGQYLADSSISVPDENIKTISKRFKGKVASIEVIVAENMVSKEYPFDINKIALQYGQSGKGAQIGMMTTSKKAFLRKYAKTKYKDACKDKQKVELGGFLVCLNKFGDRLGQEIGGEFDVVAPAEEALQNDLTAGVLSIDSVQTESGEKIAFNKNEKVAFEYKFNARYNEKKKDWEIVNKRLYGSNVKIFSDKEKLKNKKISVVNGTLTIRIPKQPKHFDLDADEIGVFKKSKNGITANVAAFEDWNTYIDLKGPVNKIMRFMALAKGGTILKTANDRINEKQYSTLGKSKGDKEKNTSSPKKWQGMITIYGKPEVIRIYYADDFELIKRKFKFSINK